MAPLLVAAVSIALQFSPWTPPAPLPVPTTFALQGFVGAWNAPTAQTDAPVFTTTEEGAPAVNVTFTVPDGVDACRIDQVFADSDGKIITAIKLGEGAVTPATHPHLRAELATAKDAQAMGLPFNGYVIGIICSNAEDPSAETSRWSILYHLDATAPT
ncbi:MAG: hypothetical protein ABSD03_10985 [Vulcanimicrobiaceae bacterium]|jgi:hypothetical protein